jgi:hypothetical protein
MGTGLVMELVKWSDLAQVLLMGLELVLLLVMEMVMELVLEMGLVQPKLAFSRLVFCPVWYR